MTLTRKQKDHIRILKRRQAYLTDYLKNEADDKYPGVHWDMQEIAALSFALETIGRVYPDAGEEDRG